MAGLNTNSQIIVVDEKYEYFQKAGFGSHYQLLIYLFNLDNIYRIYLGSVLKFFADPQVHSLLSLWSDVSEEAAIFKKFSEFLVDERVCFKYTAFRDARPVREQLKGNLESQYLLALVIERLPLTHKAGKDWHRTLTTWLVLRVIKYAREQKYDDDHLIDVITRLRMSADNNPEALDIVQSLMLPDHQTYYFSEIESQLEHKPLIELKRDGLSSAIINFLNSTVKVAKLDFKAAKTNKYRGNSSLPTFNADFSDTGVVQSIDDAWGLPSALGELNHLSNSDEENEDVQDFTYPPENEANTESRLILSDQSVLLTTTINAQFALFDPHILTDYEINALNQFILQQLESVDEKVSTLSAITYIAIRTSRSLERALTIPISHTVDREWALNPFDCNLYRLPPSRKSDWKPKESQKHWLNGFAELNKIALPVSVQAIIRKRIESLGSAQVLIDLWSDTWPSYSHLFDELFLHFRNVTPSGLASIYPSAFFRSFQDEPVTHLIASHPQTGLPASCAYANFKVSDLTTLKGQPFPFELPSVDDELNTSPSTILFGSVLDVSEDLLKQEIQALNSKYSSIMESKSSFAEKHNALTAYVLYMLYASTGGRPIKDPFESLQHFDFESALVFIDDKAIEGDLTGRVVPLPKSLCAFIRDVYLRHLKILANELADKNQQLSFEILQTALQKPTGMMPLFFYIDVADKTQEWRSVFPKSLKQHNLFSCPLPDNLFRHRFAKRMRECGIDSEIIAGLLGHVDFGCALYGFFSHRCFLDDMQVARPVIEQIFKDLLFNLDIRFHHIENLRLQTEHIVLDNTQLEVPIPLYGKEARRVAREKRHEAWTKEAKKDIDKALTDLGTSFESLNAVHIDELLNRMLFSQKDLPRTNRAFRYDFLLKTLEEHSQKNKFVYQFKKRYVTYRPESIFDETAMYALGTFKTIKKSLKSADQLKCVSRLNKLAVLQLIPILLMIETRLCDLGQIKTVLKENQYLIIANKDEYFLEVSNISAHTSINPVRRYKISPQCAYLLDSNKKQLNDKVMSQALDDALKPIFSNIAHLNIDDYGAFLKSLSNIVHQANCLQLTGIEAGYLSGQLESYGLLRADWVYLRFGERLNFNDKVKTNTESAVDLLNIAFKASLIYTYEDAKAFIDQLRKTIDSNYPDNKSVARTAVITKIETHINNHDTRISSALILFAKWIKSIINEGPRKKYLMPGSVRTYFDTLCKPFLEQLYDQDLFLFDEDDMTDAYTNIINASKADNKGYLSNRLLEFHRFATTVGIVEPDWTEVPLENVGTKVAPGFIHESEYIATLKSLYNDRTNVSCNTLQACMLLILAMRFGLRANEVLGLLKDDWYEIDGQIWLDIKPNYIRKLKRRLSKRKVPLFFKLSKIEQTIINRFMAEFEAKHVTKSNVPLFNMHQKPLDKKQNRLLRLYVNFKLKEVTGNSRLSLHDCRHTAANHFSLSLLDVKLKGWKEVTLLSNTRATFIGSSRVSKKLSWLSARYLGHSVLETQYKNYLHYLPELAERHFESIIDVRERYTLSSARVIQLEKVAQANLPNLDLLQFVPPKPTALTPQTLLTVFKLIGLGRPAAFIADRLNIDLTKIDLIFNLVNEHLRFAMVKNEHVDASSFFVALTEMSWIRVRNQLDTDADDVLNQALTTNREIYRLRSNQSNFVHKEMIGASRQIILITDESFHVFKLMMDIFRLTQNDFVVYLKKPNSIDQAVECEIQRIERCLSEINLAEVARENTKISKNAQTQDNKQSKNIIQLDSIPVRGIYISTRVNIVAQEDAKNAKSSMELVTMLLTTIVYIELTC